MYYGRTVGGTGQIWLDGVRCGGQEKTITECVHNGWGNTCSNHSTDVWITCYNYEYHDDYDCEYISVRNWKHSKCSNFRQGSFDLFRLRCIACVFGTVAEPTMRSIYNCKYGNGKIHSKIPDSDYHQNLIYWSLDYVQPFHKFHKVLTISFEHFSVNRQTDRQTNWHGWKHNLLSGGNYYGSTLTIPTHKKQFYKFW